VKKTNKPAVAGGCIEFVFENNKGKSKGGDGGENNIQPLRWYPAPNLQEPRSVQIPGKKNRKKEKEKGEFWVDQTRKQPQPLDELLSSGSGKKSVDQVKKRGDRGNTRELLRG